MRPDEAFCKKRIDRAKALSFGFRPRGDALFYRRELAEGAFAVTVTVDAADNVRAEVTDVLNDEPYTALFNEKYTGAYVGAVRTAYAALLSEIAAACFVPAPFTAPQANRVTALVRERYGVEPDFPFEDDPYGACGAFRHTDNGKWFALLMPLEKSRLLKDGDKTRVDVLNVKASPADVPALWREPGVFPAYHMNRAHWISLLLDDTLSDARVMELISDSFTLTAPRGRK